jgi:hypothetical protein
VSERIDSAIDTIVCEYLSRIKTTIKSKSLKKHYNKKVAEMKSEQFEIERIIKENEERLKVLLAEISKSLTGDSEFEPDVLAAEINNTKDELHNSEKKLLDINDSLSNNQSVIKNLDFYYDQLNDWAGKYQGASLEQRKMIICQLIKEIYVSKGYELDIIMDMNYEQFLSGSQSH